MTGVSRGALRRLGIAVIAQTPDVVGPTDDGENPLEWFVPIGERIVASWSSTPYRAPNPERDLAELRERLTDINDERCRSQVRLRRAIDERDEYTTRVVS